MSDIVPAEPKRASARRPLIVGSVVVGVALMVVAGFLLGRSTGGSGETVIAEPTADSDERDRETGVRDATTTTTGPDRAASKTTKTTTTGRPVSVPTDDLAAADRVAEQFLAALQGRDCDGLLALLSANTLTWLNAAQEDGQLGRDHLCDSLATEDIPPMRIRTGAERVEGGAVVEFESGEEVEPLLLVLEAKRWKVDLLGDIAERPESEDSRPTKQSELRNALTAEKVFYTDEQRYTNDVKTLEAIEPSLEWATGVAGDGANPDLVFVAVAEAGQVVCLSAIDYAGVRYMIKDSPADGITYAKGDRTPRHCDSAPLDSSW